MSALDFVWMLVNFFAPALGVGVIAPALAKLLWRREFGPARWLPLMGCAVGVSAVVLIAGLIFFDHDGKMTTYVAMTAAAALAMLGFARKADA